MPLHRQVRPIWTGGLAILCTLTTQSAPTSVKQPWWTKLANITPQLMWFWPSPSSGITVTPQHQILFTPMRHLCLIPLTNLSGHCWHAQNQIFWIRPSRLAVRSKISSPPHFPALPQPAITSPGLIRPGPRISYVFFHSHFVLFVRFRIWGKLP